MNNSDLKEKYDLFKPIIIYIDYINIEYQKYLNNKFADITPRDFTYLITIHYHPNISQRQLARLLMVSEANVGQIIRRLEKNDLIYRDFDENNRSRRIINLTEKGKSQVLSLLDASNKWESKFFEKYSIEDEMKFRQMISDYYQKSTDEQKC